ncbi:inorganic pyrophosphatase [Phakopsora pachyrhizi]|nr:inorganic pyrophosphatase [Phakopsora pachyrhizi]
METSKAEAFNPILQDIKKNKLSFVRNCFPHHGYIWNYGAFPQTWEDPEHTHPETKAKGDNNPLDVCEIGEAVGYVGQVKQFAFSGEAKHKKYATEVVMECHEAWKRLLKNGYAGISLPNTTVKRSSYRVASADVPQDSQKDPAPIDPSILKWFL